MAVTDLERDRTLKALLEALKAYLGGDFGYATVTVDVLPPDLSAVYLAVVDSFKV